MFFEKLQPASLVLNFVPLDEVPWPGSFFSATPAPPRCCSSKQEVSVMAEPLQLCLGASESPVEVSSFVRDNESTTVRLRSTLRGARLVFPSKMAKPSIDPALLARRAYLTRRQEERDYAQMVSSVRKRPQQSDAGSAFKVQATVGLNVAVAALASFYIAYIVSASLVTRPASRVLIGLGAAVFILFVEVTLYMIRTYSVEEAERAKRRRPASGTFLRTATQEEKPKTE